MSCVSQIQGKDPLTVGVAQAWIELGPWPAGFTAETT